MTGSHGGKRPGAGKKKGSIAKKTAALVEAVTKSGITPLDYMLQVLRDENNAKDLRLDAAKSAAPYVHSKLPTAIVTPPPPSGPVAEEDESLLDRYLNGIHAEADES